MFNIFKRKNKPTTTVRSEAETLNLLCGAFSQIVVPQIRELGLEPGKVDPTGPIATLQVRIYFLSICYLLSQIGGSGAEDQRIPLTVWAFDEIYGLMIGFPLAQDTLEHFERGGTDVERAFVEAREDVALIVDDKNATTAGLIRLLRA